MLPSSGRITHWVPKKQKQDRDEIIANAICLGTGRFLRAVLVPSLVGAGLKPALVQPRGRSFMEYMASRDDLTVCRQDCYEVDTVLRDGSVSTEQIPCWGAFSLGSAIDKEAFVEWISTLQQGVQVVGVGVTEAGLSSYNTQVMKDLYELFCLIQALVQDGKWNRPNRKICVICTDNVTSNGDTIHGYMHRILTERKDTTMEIFLERHITFLNSMVDRITSQRAGTKGLVPRCEPNPMKALVLLDPGKDLPQNFENQPGVIVRSTKEELDTDIALKLRIANGTHTAISHCLALQQHVETTVLSSNEPGKMIYMNYLESLVDRQIIPGAARAVASKEAAEAVWVDWKQRLTHPYFGLSSFFITQNGCLKGGIRWGPSVRALLKDSEGQDRSNAVRLTVSFAFAYAVLLRWLTPLSINDEVAAKKFIFTGWLDGFDPREVEMQSTDTLASMEYADGLHYNMQQGWYEFKCPLVTKSTDDSDTSLPYILFKCRGKQPMGCVQAVRAYLLAKMGGNLESFTSSKHLDVFAAGIACLYARLLAGDNIHIILEELSKIGFDSTCEKVVDGIDTIYRWSSSQFGSGVPLFYRPTCIPDNSRLMELPIDIENAGAITYAEVAAAEVIDLHTHLLPPTHGPLCLWGIDEMLTYHYLVAEYFMTADASLTPECFYAMTMQEQADLVWKALFIDRLPISEACRGVVTTLQSLGLADEVSRRDLKAIRYFYSTYQKRGEAGAVDFCNKVFGIAGVRYSVMTNIPFSENEVQYWRGPKRQTYSTRFRSALRVDPLLAGDTKTIEAALRGSGYDMTIDGARQYLRDWVETMKPEYAMASTPHDFVFQEGSLGRAEKNRSVNADAMHEPFAFAKAQLANTSFACNGTEDDAPSVVNENSDFFCDVLMKTCEDFDLPIALKIGAHRGVNPRLRDAGDGVVAFADAGMLARLCTRFPKVRFLATFLSITNQQEAAVLATKFRNLHIYGCWWFCNNPSIIRAITSMRIEVLGTAFTAQHSDARVVDQLLYKWPHSRAVIASVLSLEIEKLLISGWNPTRREIRRDVQRLLGRSYEEFMEKSFK